VGYVTDVNHIKGLNVPLKSFVHFRALLLALTYLSSSLAPPGAQASLFGLIQLPVKYWPYALVALDGIMGGPAAAAQAVSGCIVGHAWWWAVFESRSVDGSAPGWVKALVSSGASTAPPPAAAPSFGTRGSGVEAIPPRAQQNARQGGYNWGGGNRLGSS
jgi:Derlin-2/3